MMPLGPEALVKEVVASVCWNAGPLPSGVDERGS